jgi:hypothetical protein
MPLCPTQEDKARRSSVHYTRYSRLVRRIGVKVSPIWRSCQATGMTFDAGLDFSFDIAKIEAKVICVAIAPLMNFQIAFLL